MSRVGNTVKKQRPVNLDLQTIDFPVTAIASIVHRVSGIIVFVALAIMLWLLAESLGSPEGFENVAGLSDNFLIKFILWGTLTALAYHIVVGVRHVIMDLGYWEEMESASQSAKVAFAITVVLSLLAGVMVW